MRARLLRAARQGWPLPIILAAAALAYLPALTAPFWLDDYFYLVAARDLPTPDYIRAVFTPWGSEPLLPFTRDFWRPLAFLVFELLEPLAGGRPLPYHLAVLAGHLAAVVLTWSIAARVDPRPAVRAIAAGTVALYPGSYQAVAWVSSINSLALPLVLGAWLAFLAGTSGATVRWRRITLAAALLALGAMARESAWVALPLIVGWHLAVTSRWQLRRRETWLPLLPFPLLAAAYVLIRTRLFTEPLANPDIFAWNEQALQNYRALLEQLLVPFREQLFGVSGWRQAVQQLSLPVVPALALAAIILRRWEPAVLLAGALLSLLAVAPNQVGVGPRYLYFTVPWLALGLAILLADLFQRVPSASRLLYPPPRASSSSSWARGSSPTASPTGPAGAPANSSAGSMPFVPPTPSFLPAPPSTLPGTFPAGSLFSTASTSVPRFAGTTPRPPAPSTSRLASSPAPGPATCSSSPPDAFPTYTPTVPRTERGYRCSACGWTSVAYVGRCAACQAWNTLQPFAEAPRAAASRRPAAGPAPLLRLADVEHDTATRFVTAIPEFDRVLGGGIVPGSLILVGGDPGIGKSTLMLQAAARLTDRGLRVACLCGEESPRQVRMRAERLGVAAAPIDLIAEPGLDAALAAAEAAAIDVLVVDSIQSVTVEGLESRAGGPAQLAEAGARLLAFAKSTGTATLVTGHVTKSGDVAGPRLLEHLVDVVLYFESAEGGVLRLLRAVKNRFGATDEIGLFEMTGAGLQSVENPSAVLLAPHTPGASGCAITAVMEGSRPLAVEVQALAVPTALAAPRRIAAGIEPARLHLLLAVLARRGGIPSGQLDIVASVSGGLRLRDTSADLAACLALASAICDRPLPAGMAFLGELALSGAVRPIHQSSRRLAELARLGIAAAVVPPGTPDVEGLRLLRAATLSEALDAAGLSGLPVRPVPHHDALQQPQRSEQAHQ
ncbi:MAG: hypothetical protein KatS3mg062_0839 [Tepidiforma sp.]|nr:MAG: hypothetical protein KatS3mg062_0839 [Tepidiforma sp.]